MRVDQVLAGYAEGDAISQEARCIRAALRRLGFASDIYAPRQQTAHQVAHDCRPLNDYRATRADTCIFHYSIGSDSASLLAATPARSILRYHNITPPHFFRGLDDPLAQQLEEGLECLPAMMATADEIWSVSDFNAEGIVPPEGTALRTIPLFFDVETFSETVDPAMDAGLAPTLNVLFVGRMSPNKCVEDLLSAMAWLAANEPTTPYRLLLAGSGNSCPRYFALLQWIAERLDLQKVDFLGYLTPEQLNACYSRAAVFVTASRHEGYCLPIVEAMSHHVPVIARACGGIPQTMGTSGLLFDDTSAAELAALIHMACTDHSLRTALIEAQNTRYLQLCREPDAELDTLLGENTPPTH